MLKHNIPFPSTWKQLKVSVWSKLTFSVMARIRKFYWLNKSYRDTNPQMVYKELQEKYNQKLVEKLAMKKKQVNNAYANCGIGNIKY